MNIEKMKHVDIRTVDRSTLAELQEIQVRKKPNNEIDLDELHRQTQNFYCYRVGDIVVSFDYAKNGMSIDDIFSVMVKAGDSHLCVNGG